MSRAAVCASLVGQVFVEGGGEEHGNTVFQANGEERHMLQRQPPASMQHATGWVPAHNEK
jgi:hypothetical protein